MKKSEQAERKSVEFTFAASPGAKVEVAGTFNDWKPAPMKAGRGKANSQYRTTLMLPKGTHEYKFVVDGQWQADPSNCQQTANSMGTLNSVINV